jgi:hypothetical protein
MLSNTAKLTLAVFVVAFAGTSADAQIHPRCARAKDRVLCTCLLSNGAQRWHVPGKGFGVAVVSQPQGDAVSRCLYNHGRR